jgi:hypothetical protein
MTELPASTIRLIETWRQIIVGGRKSWVLFRNGTCVLLIEPEDDLVGQAVGLMKRWGPVRVATPAGDFATIALSEHPGWVVTGHHPDILTYVSPEEMAESNPPAVVVGLLGRSKRNQDAQELQILHVEDKRPA